METVMPAALPAQLSMSIKDAARRLGPEDELDERAKARTLEKGDEPALARRRATIVGAALRCAAAAGVSPETTSSLSALKPDQVDAWLLKQVLTAKQGDRVVRNTGNEARKAAYYAALTVRAAYPSQAAAYLLQVASSAARAIEQAQHREGGAAHALVVGLIGQAS